MNTCEDWQFADIALERIDVFRLVLGSLVKALNGVELDLVVVAHDLVEVTVLVSEHAAVAIHATLILEEGSAIFSSSLGNLLEDIKFVFTVRKLAFIAVSALVFLDPVRAHLGLVLLFIDFFVALCILRDLGGLLRGVA